ncbi:uncharacterized protein E0L32_005052 [Thyridium curvatum]|uniref:GDP/GTP exchange factor Sec2 N-terminal domain-containing protein n=1 Tax=Thyridium curvatum TaxID=1093900 RepID=A0A507B542_9PEZI|nr:uncharacterized protein E0L32_005052 [Thyridium curvatum]TPX14943.1 hypothetical protein E0L32_005052 [Thyridium curvatum]
MSSHFWTTHHPPQTLEALRYAIRADLQATATSGLERGNNGGPFLCSGLALALAPLSSSLLHHGNPHQESRPEPDIVFLLLLSCHATRSFHTIDTPELRIVCLACSFRPDILPKLYRLVSRSTFRASALAASPRLTRPNPTAAPPCETWDTRAHKEQVAFLVSHIDAINKLSAQPEPGAVRQPRAAWVGVDPAAEPPTTVSSQAGRKTDPRQPWILILDFLTHDFFVHLAGWSQYQSPHHNPRAYGHIRSYSSVTKPTVTTTTTVSDSVETASTTSAPSHPQQVRRIHSSISATSYDDKNDLTTLPDPRSRAMSPASADAMASSEHHPDLDDEVATLSTKLINAINHQTTLDDTLSRTRMELDQSHERIRKLEEQLAQQREMLAGDVWVRRKAADAEKAKVLNRLVEEKKAREEVDQQKKKIEQELENLTTALFEEANKMVISAKEEARVEHEALQKKNDLLKAQLVDTEGLLKSSQEQLAELKNVMEQMSVERDDQTAITAPSSPGFSKFDQKDDDQAVSDGISHAGTAEPASPSHPTSFSHLLQPVLRFDLAAYQDFIDLVRLSKRQARSRPPSGNQSGLSALGIGLGGASNGSTTSLTTSGTAVSASAPSPQTPNTPNSTVSSGSMGSAAPLPPLKDTKFYKRALAEDIEPTLRLDTAPGLSWLVRRSVLHAMTDGSLVVEPVLPTEPLAHITKPQNFPCSLCGDSRKEGEHLRRHRFRTSESPTAQRYPLCGYCLGRVRSTCDFLGFLRIVKDGHWRADDDEGERAAWEESVRLREQMFWSRIGGGVVPTPVVMGSPPGGLGGGRSPRLAAGEEEEEEAARGRPSIDEKVMGGVSEAKRVASEETIGAEKVAAPEMVEDEDEGRGEEDGGGAKVAAEARPESTTPQPTAPAAAPAPAPAAVEDEPSEHHEAHAEKEGAPKRLSLQIPS